MRVLGGASARTFLPTFGDSSGTQRFHLGNQTAPSPGALFCSKELILRLAHDTEDRFRKLVEPGVWGERREGHDTERVRW
jgi:hypothetical protein